ncbi:DUF6236 family protein [Enterobacter sp. WI-ESBL-E8]
MKKGIITNPAKFTFDGRSVKAESFIDSKDVRYLLMYWDRIIIPQNNVIYDEATSEQEVLIDQGFLERPLHSVEFNGALNASFLMQAVLDSQIIATKKVKEAEPEVEWAIHQFSEELLLGEEAMDEKRTIRINLINALPSPPEHAPIEEVIDFKLRRSDMLAAFHKQMDDLYIDALKCPDRSLGFNRSLDQLNEILRDLERVSNEKWPVLNRFNWSPQYNFDVAAIAGLSNAAFEYFTTQSIHNFSGLMAAGLAFLSIQAKITSTPEWNKNNPILAYLTAAKREGVM